MRRKTLSMAFAALFIGVAVTRAGLDATPLLNASFESVEDGGTPGGWGYIIDDWYENERGSYFSCFYEQGSGIGLVGDGDIWVGNQTGGRFYQDVGTVDDGVAYEITALIGSRWGTSFQDGVFNLYASTADAGTNALDGVELSSFATLLSTINVTTNSGVATGAPNVFTVTVNLSTATGHDGEVLWLEFGSASGKDYFDNISIALSSAATAPGPAWTNSVITNVTEGVINYAYSDFIANMAIDPDGDAITYALTAGNPWLTVDSSGKLSGTPNVLGTNTFTVTATDGTGTPAEATLKIHVRAGASPEWAEPVTASDALLDEQYADTLAGKATDPDGAPITYTLQDAGTWLSVSNNGALSGMPTISDEGTNTFTVIADDGIDTPTPTTLTILVRGAFPPVWDEPVTATDAITDKPYSASISGKATDPEGEPITYTLQDVGTWLNVDPNGILSGAPTVSDEGTNTFTVIANDGQDTPTPATLTIVVKGPTDNRIISIDFNNTTDPAWSVSDSEEAGPLHSINWNTTATASGGPQALIDDLGDASAATITWLTGGQWSNGDNNDTLDRQLAHSYLDDGGDGVLVTVSNIPYASYRVYGMVSTDQGDEYLMRNFQVNGEWVSGGDASTTAPAYGNIRNIPGGGPWIEMSTVTRGNYWVFETSGSTLVIDGQGRNGAQRGCLTAILIEALALPPGDAVTVMIAGPVTAGSEMEISWESQLNYDYTVETNSNLIVSDGWEAFMTGVPGNGGTVTVTNTIGPDQTFYQVITE